MTRQRNGGRERLAWAFLLFGFALWLSLVVAVPVSASRILQKARRPLLLLIQANEGTIGLEDRDGRRPAVLAGDPPQEIEGAVNILTNTTDTALINVHTPDEEQILARFEVYENTSLEVLEAAAPRFSVSTEAHELGLNLKAGRLRLSVPPREGRPLVVRLLTPQVSEVLLREPGQYVLEANNTQTWVTVQEGQALVQAAGKGLYLNSGEGSVVNLDSQPIGPLDNQRELLTNGDFNDELAGWDRLAWTIERANQASGETRVLDERGEKVLNFDRVGEGAARAEVQQPLNQDVSGFQSLELVVTMQVVNQTLPVCGEVGSECPLFVAINYEDVYGANRTWQQGFYAVGTATPNFTPGVCTTCGHPVTGHVQVPLNQLRSWESGNLMAQLTQENVPPRRLKSISLIAQGHTFETQVLDVSLTVRE